MTEYTFCEDTFSDLHKDAFGFRPRNHEFYSASPERKQEIWEDLCNFFEHEQERDRLAGIERQRDLETRITEAQELGAGDRFNAIRWIFEAEDFSENDLRLGGEYVCYHFGIDFAFEAEFDQVCQELLSEYK